MTDITNRTIAINLSKNGNGTGMNHIYTIKFFLFFSFITSASTLVISDVDDTIRQSNVLNLPRAAIGTLLRKAPEFQTLKNIFNQLNFHYLKSDINFYYLSASPKCFLDYDNWVYEKKFPMGSVIQRPCNFKWLIPNYTAKFKFKVIDDIIQEKLKTSSISQVLLFGDNAESDAQVYQEIKKKFTNVAIEIFIRDIRVEATAVDDALSIKRLEGVNYFLTEFDLIGHSQFYFLTDQQKESIKQDFKTGQLYPKYLYENLAKRYEKELGIDDDQTLELAYHSLINQLNIEAN